MKIASFIAAISATLAFTQLSVVAQINGRIETGSGYDDNVSKVWYDYSGNDITFSIDTGF